MRKSAKDTGSSLCKNCASGTPSRRPKRTRDSSQIPLSQRPTDTAILKEISDNVEKS
jgi:hypothetical protein